MTNKKTTRRALFSSVMALFLCCSMLIGTTFAWFTDTVTSTGNIIKSGTLDVEMYWADGTKAVPDKDSSDWRDASKGAIFNYDRWEPGYTEVRHIRIANKGTLALKYQLQIDATGVVSKLAEVIDVYFIDPAQQIGERANLPAGNYVGTLKEVLTGGITKARGDLVKDQDVEVTLALKMQETAGNEYQDLAIGSDFKVVLLATQMEAELDSFGNDYDGNSNYPGAPIANVTELSELDVNAIMNGFSGTAEPIKLNAGYQFTPTETYEEVLLSDYKDWQADFVVSADRDIPAGAVALAGYYSAFCELIDHNWIALTANTVISAGTKINLIEAMGGGSITVHYEDIGMYGNDGVGFCCGIAEMPGNTDALAGTTINVELRLYKTEEGNRQNKVDPEEYIVIGSYSYTFPTANVSTTEELAAALGEGKDVKLEADIVLTEAIEVAGDVNVDLNGYALDASEAASAFIVAEEEAANLTINADEEEVELGASGLVEVAAGADAVIEINGGNFISDDAGSTLIKPNGTGDITIKLTDVNYKSTAANGYALDCSYYQGQNLKVEIEGGSFEATTGLLLPEGSSVTGAEITVNNTKNMQPAVYAMGDMTIENCIIKADKSHAVAVAGGATLTVIDCEVYAGSDAGALAFQVFSSGGTIHVNNSTYEGGYGTTGKMNSGCVAIITIDGTEVFRKG